MSASGSQVHAATAKVVQPDTATGVTQSSTASAAQTATSSPPITAPHTGSIMVRIVRPNDEHTEFLKLQAMQKEHEKELLAMKKAFHAIFQKLQNESQAIGDAIKTATVAPTQSRTTYLPQFNQTNSIDSIQAKFNAQKELLTEFQGYFQAWLKKLGADVREPQKRTETALSMARKTQPKQKSSKLKQDEAASIKPLTLLDISPLPYDYRLTVKQMGTDLDIFNKKFTELRNLCLKNKNKLKNTTALRMIGEISVLLHKPLIISMIADDVQNFKRFFDENVGDVFCLEFCCFSGSKNIIKGFFMADEKRKSCLLTSENALAYSLSSGDEDLAMFLAQESIKLGKKDPGPITLYSLGKFALSARIDEMFSSQKAAASFTK